LAVLPSVSLDFSSLVSRVVSKRVIIFSRSSRVLDRRLGFVHFLCFCGVCTESTGVLRMRRGRVRMVAVI
jgi:hypothetical protein